MPPQGTTRTDAPLAAAGCGVFEAPGVGPLWLGWVPEGIAILSFGATPRPEDVTRFAPELAGCPQTELPPLLSDGLGRYFAGDPFDPSALPVRLGGTKFQRRVWAALRRVARGAVRSYARLAEDARSPRAMRAVGVAMAANPIAIAVPCHRCVAKGNALGGFSGGLDRKRYLLELEGVRVEGDRVLPGQLTF